MLTRPNRLLFYTYDRVHAEMTEAMVTSFASVVETRHRPTASRKMKCGRERACR